MSATQPDHLVKMANDIARNLAAWGDEAVVAAKVADHLRRFWTPAMRAQLAATAHDPDAPLLPAVRRALAADPATT